MRQSNSDVWSLHKRNGTPGTHNSPTYCCSDEILKRNIHTRIDTVTFYNLTFYVASSTL